MEEYPVHFLYPAAIFVAPKPYFIKTILGSCVAVCLWDAKNRIGGMNHYMLPLWNGQGLASPKYGNIAIAKLLEKLISSGAQREHIVAKVFGGGEVIETEQSNFFIGERNAQLATEVLRTEKIPIRGESLRGKLGRKIIFNTFTGEVKMRYIKKNNT